MTLGMLLMANHVSATSDVPTEYSLETVSIAISHKTGRGIAGGYEIAINGSGSSFFIRHDMQKKTIFVDKATLLGLLNDLYKFHYFELPDTYTIKKKVILKDAATLATVATKMIDMGSKRICVQLADYNKCLTVVDNQPADIASLISKIEKLVTNL